ncbi:MAG: hypothetical protein GWO40_16050, partial [Gammaproteobacteria bacterium]|nr:hypothetical protein [Gemmatimonadota bacterium]NIR84729.1 hypothetical protein [Gammaproteobacteria bacterium]NIU05770.1 hypothetical protein [Gammaproteobacteria bacterium]NIV52893.1 hypothetical protein [Gammaproteobacteria bacterium]NIX87043.1 hypothetical protein [Gammaproteobacteria bacterium]
PNPNAGIDPTSVIATANRGTVVNVNSDGTLDYRPPASGSSDTVTYTVSDSLGMPCSPAGTVDIGITDIFNHAPTSWNRDDITAVLAYEAGIPDPSGDKSDKPQSGSFFSMEMQPGEFIYTVLEPGTAGGLVIGQEMASETSHSGAPTGKEVAAFDQGWNFFGNTGMHFTRKGGIRVEESDPAFNNTLLFRDRWFVTWNGIEAINQGGCVIGGTPPCSDFVKEDDPGHASLECSSEPCEDGSSF